MSKEGKPSTPRTVGAMCLEPLPSEVYLVDTDEGRQYKGIEYISLEIVSWIVAAKTLGDCLDVMKRIRHIMQQVEEQGGAVAYEAVVFKIGISRDCSGKVFNFLCLMGCTVLDIQSQLSVLTPAQLEEVRL